MSITMTSTITRSALLAGGIGLAAGVGATVANRPAEDRLGRSDGFISGREIGTSVGLGAGAGAMLLGTMAVMGEGIGAWRLAGAAIGLGVAAIGTGLALAATNRDPGVTFSSVAHDLVDRYDHDDDGRLVGTARPTIRPGNESTRTDGSSYMSINRLMIEIDKRDSEGRLTATSHDIAAVVQRYDANGDGRLQRAERRDFDAELGERPTPFR